MQNPIVARLGVAAGFALAAALAAGLVYSKRDLLFEWDWAHAHGKLEESVDPRLVSAARDFAERSRAGEACVARPLARDDRYLYAAIGCGAFRAAGDAPKLQPSRLRYAGDAVSALEQPQPEAYENSVRRLMPREAWEKMRYGFPREEVLQAGLARMKERGLN